jgi:hypothetical protein
LEITGGRTAVNEAEAKLFLFVPLSVVERNPLTLLWGPEVVAVMFTLTVHEPLAGMVPPEKLRLVFPAAGAQVGGPPQVVLADGVAATCRPVGNASVKAAPVNCVVLVLVSVKVNVDVPLTATGSGEKDLEIVGMMGVVQPVKRMLSRYTSEPLLVLPELKA